MSPQAHFKTMGGTGPDCVLIHGFASDRMSWAANTVALMGVASVHAVDLPAHGEASADIGDGSIDALANSIAVALEENQISKTHIIGHSLGGAIALKLAAKHPDIIASLTLIAPVGLGSGLDYYFLRGITNNSDHDATLVLLRQLVVKPHLINKLVVKRLLDQLAKPEIRKSWSKIIDQLQSVAEFDVPGTLKSLPHSLPKLVIWGDGDHINPLCFARLEEFGLKPTIIAETGHIPHIEKADPFNRLATSFLSSLDH